MTWREVALGSAIHVKHGFAFKGDLFVDHGDYIVLTPGNFNARRRCKGANDRQERTAGQKGRFIGQCVDDFGGFDGQGR